MSQTKQLLRSVSASIRGDSVIDLDGQILASTGALSVHLPQFTPLIVAKDGAVTSLDGAVLAPAGTVNFDATVPAGGVVVLV